MTDMIPAWVEGTLTPMDKLEVHRLGLRHKAVSVFVLAGERVLIQRRAASKYHTPGLWANTCCTHPHWDEPAAACAVRRLREELGIDGLALSAAETVEYRADVGNGMTEHELVEIFVAEAPADLSVSPAPAEVSAVRWIALRDLLEEVEDEPERFTPWLRIYLSDHRDRIFGRRVGSS
ncbi:isopentenyl-diphosphate Delta-isomerase [Frigidibacter sp.]|uniref:isopentenyl-diphosphate Delta-isomerase n=1 Tax=Frigidibacter sp. TaxID=2586418 RepID=UPI002732DF14|nr:isopentenyl-diphosphate Delta-isomerase [Frigidibacter sp.]MDP3339153.1 isopentenyl-diphosphate Delta-isomerase [Frigidibacter sp.]